MSKNMIFSIIRGVTLGLTLITIHASCSLARFVPKHSDLTPELEKYRGYINYISNGKLGKKDINLGFIKVDENSSLLGECNFVLPLWKKEIDIVKSKWQNFSHDRKVVLIAHEFRHCECNHYYHTEDYYLDGCSKSIMDTYLPDESCIRDHMNDYLDEIRRGCDV